MPIYEFEGKKPKIGDGSFIAPSAEIIGDVKIGTNCFIGFGAIIRADFGPIYIDTEEHLQKKSKICRKQI